jgi:peptidoglycan/xylan/chitin deacetylase (PgdA/CDA1 family)
MIYWGIPTIISTMSSAFKWHGSRKNKVIYLTFDDGPTPNVTEKVLDILDQFSAKATFFCLGRNVDRHKSIYNKIIEKGHKPGNHSYSHLKGWRTSNKTYYQDIELASKYIRSSLFRPPYGQIKRKQAKYLQKHYRLIMWDVLTHDYNKNISPEVILKHSIRHTHNGSIIVFHDSLKSSKNLFYILPKYLEYFSNKGFNFECIE